MTHLASWVSQSRFWYTIIVQFGRFHARCLTFAGAVFIIVVDVRVACVAGVVAGITCAMCETAVFRASERGVAERVRWSSGPLRATHLTRGGGGVLCGGPSPGAVHDDADGAWAFGVGAWRRRC